MAAGTAFFLLLVVHHWLNRRWAPSLARGRWNAARYLQAGSNLCLVVIMGALLWSSLILARPLLGRLPVPGSMTLGREMHMVSAYWGFLVMSFHIGLHGDMLASRPVGPVPDQVGGICSGTAAFRIRPVGILEQGLARYSVFAK